MNPLIDIDATKTEEGGPVINVLARKAAERRAKKRQPVTLSVQDDPTMKIRYSTLIPYDTKKRWETNAQDGLDYGLTVLATQCEAIIINDEEVEGEDGKVLTFKSPEFVRLFGGSTIKDSIQIMFGGDERSGYADIDEHAVRIFEAAGLGPRERPKDPLD